MYKQEAPFSIQIELTKGCNLQCSFCGINGFQDKPGKGLEFMTSDDAWIVANRIRDTGWNSRIEFAMRGEPTMNTDWLKILSIFRETLPRHQLMVTSNGGGIVASRDINGTINEFFKYGDILALDEYEKVNFANRIRNGIDEFQLSDAGVTVYEYPEDKEGNPHRRSKYKFLSFIAPINLSDKGTHALLNNHCGSGSELDMSQNESLCAKPFRELAINYDGSVNLCCNDFIAEYTCGNIIENDIEEVWNNKYFESARKMLMQRDRNQLRPCRGCNAKSYRVGLLPDKFGKVVLPEPDDTDRENVMYALRNGPDRGPTKLAEERIIPTLTVEEEGNWL